MKSVLTDVCILLVIGVIILAGYVVSATGRKIVDVPTPAPAVQCPAGCDCCDYDGIKRRR